MNSLWIAIYLFSMSWLASVPAFTPIKPGWALFLIGLGTAFSVFAFRNSEILRLDRRYLLLVVPIIPSAVLIPFPYNLGPVLLGLGLVLQSLCSRLSLMGWGVAFSGIVLSAQSAVIPIYYLFASHYHAVSALATPAALLLRALGCKTMVSGSTLFVESNGQVLACATTLEKLGLLSSMVIFTGGAVLVFLLSSRKIRDLAALLGTLIAYAVARYILLILLYADGGKINIFWHPAAVAASYIPLSVLLFKIFDGLSLPEFQPFRADRKLYVLSGLSFLSIWLLIGAWGLRDPGELKQGRILIDEKHSNWEWTTREYDTSWYGQRSGYNYSSLYRFLSFYYRAQRNFEPISSDLLSGCDVLILKTPTESFSDEEVESIVRFVEDGGGLFLISDHTNVFGMSTFLNPIAKRFGLRFRYDATYELSSGSLSEYDPPWMIPHPIVRGLPHFLFGSSCSLEAPLLSDSVIIGYGLKSVPADYSQKSFFPVDLETLEMELGLFLQADAVRFGKGRVVAFTDSTVFSNFWMFMPGKAELFLGSTEWLNRRNSLPDMRIILVACGLLAALVTVYVASFHKGFLPVAVVFSLGSLAIPLAVNGFGFINMSNYPPPQPHTSPVRVCFDMKHSSFALPSSIEGFTAGVNRRFDTFFVWSQRLGYIPSAEATLEAALEKASLVVIINPKTSFTQWEKESIKVFLQKGGRILLLDSARNKSSTSNELLESFGMRMRQGHKGSYETRFGSAQSVVTSLEAAVVEGGESLVATEKGQSILSISHEGEGVLAAFSDSHLFSNAQMGDVSGVPDDKQRGIGELEFWILRTLLDQD